MEGDYPTPVYPVQNTALSYDATFLHTLVYSWIKLTSGKFAKKVAMIKDLVKGTQFKPMRLQGCRELMNISQNHVVLSAKDV